MSEFTEALRMKILALEDELEESEDTVSRLKTKIEMLNELLEEEDSSDTPTTSSKKKGRPKGSRNKRKTAASKTTPDDATVGFAGTLSESESAELSRMEGTDPELAKKIASRKFTPQARPATSYGPGVRVGGGKQAPAVDSPKSNTNITIEDEDQDVQI